METKYICVPLYIVPPGLEFKLVDDPNNDVTYARVSAVNTRLVKCACFSGKVFKKYYDINIGKDVYIHEYDIRMLHYT